MAYDLPVALTTPAQTRSWISEIALVLGASCLIGLIAPLSVYLPFSPVPISLATAIVLFFGALLGSKRGALAALGYLMQGAMGFPVFAGGKAGLLVLAGPTGGYLLGYVIAAYVAGLIIERSQVRTMSRACIALAAGSLTVYLFGMSHLSLFIGIKAAFTLGVLPFVIGDFIKTFLILKALKTLKFFNA